MAGIFISYRRDDSAGYTGRLMDDMKQQFEPEQIFRDIEAIEAGADFIEVIDQAVGSCTLLLAVIGPRWLGATESKGNRRLEDAHDFVRLEIAAALTRGIKVIPVLVGGATMPAGEDLPEPLKPLARRQAHEITDRRWDYDVGQLFETIGKIPGIAPRKRTAPPAATRAGVPPPGKQPKRGMPTGVKLLFGVIAAVFALIIYGAFQHDKTAEDLNLIPDQAPASDRMASTTQLAALPPVTPVPAAVARGPSVKDPPAPTASAAVPPPAPAEPMAVAPLNLTGNWRTQQGDAFYIEQSGSELAVLAADAQANHGFMGRGVLRGQQVELTLTHLQSGGTLSMRMNVSPDARRMIGVAQEHATGSSENLVLLRE